MAFGYNPYEKKTGIDWNASVADKAAMGMGLGGRATYGDRIREASAGISDIQGRQGLGAAAKVGASGQSPLQQRMAIGASGQTGLQGASQAANSRLAGDVGASQMDVGQWRQRQQAMYSQQQLADQRQGAYQSGLAQIAAAKKKAEGEEDAAIREGIGGLFGGLGGLAGGIGILSDEACKMGINDIGSKAGMSGMGAKMGNPTERVDYGRGVGISRGDTSSDGGFKYTSGDGQGSALGDLKNWQSITQSPSQGGGNFLQKAIGIAALASDPRLKDEVRELRSRNKFLSGVVASGGAALSGLPTNLGASYVTGRMMAPHRAITAEHGGMRKGNEYAAAAEATPSNRTPSNRMTFDEKTVSYDDPSLMMSRNSMVDNLASAGPAKAQSGGMSEASMMGPVTYQMRGRGPGERNDWGLGELSRDYPAIREQSYQDLDRTYDTMVRHKLAKPSRPTPERMPVGRGDIARLGYEGATTGLKGAVGQRRNQLLAELDELDAMSGGSPDYRPGAGGPMWRQSIEEEERSNLLGPLPPWIDPLEYEYERGKR